MSDINKKQSKPRKNTISVSAGSFSGLTNELVLLKQKYKLSALSSPPASTTSTAGPDKVYKRGVAKSLKGRKNKIDKVNAFISLPPSFKSEMSSSNKRFAIIGVGQVEAQNETKRRYREKGIW